MERDDDEVKEEEVVEEQTQPFLWLTQISNEIQKNEHL